MKKIISIILASALIFSSFGAFAFFDDIDDATMSWAGEAIGHLTDIGVINGYDDGTFRPAGNVTRAEFAKMLCVAFELELTDAEYDDISSSWANEYIKSVADVMYTEGASFEPDAPATRADIAYAAASVLKLEMSDETAAGKFADCNEVKETMRDKVVAAVENGIVLGYDDGTLRPESFVSRAEAAVIIFRALKIKNALPEVPEVPGVSQEPEVSDPEPTPPSDEQPGTEKGHIYTLYPGRDILLISSVSATSMTVDDEEAYRITYRMASDTDAKEYSSLIPADLEIRGVKSSVSELKSGDILTMNTAFHGYIGYLYVFASFERSVPLFDREVTSYGDYDIVSGKLIDMSANGKTVILKIDTGDGVKDEMILSKLETNVYSSWKKADKWSVGYLGDIDLENESVYVFVRYTNGVATDIVVSDIVR